MERQVVGLGAVAFEEPSLGLTDVHDAQELGIGQQLDVVIGGGRRGRDEAVGDPLAVRAVDAAGPAVAGAQPHHLAEGLGPAKAPQNGRLVQAHHVELGRVELAVADTLVVGQEDAVGVSGQRLVLETPHLVDRPHEQRRLAHAQDVDRVAAELLSHPQWQDDQGPALSALLGQDVGEHEPARLQLHDGLAQAEGREARPAAAGHEPADDRPLVRLAHGADLGWVDVEAAPLGQLDLGPQEGLVILVNHRGHRGRRGNHS